MRNVLFAITILLPWPLRRLVLMSFFGFDLHPTSRIGVSWIFPRRLVLEENARIGHLTVCKGLDLLQLKANARIGPLNWITGYPSALKQFFADDTERKPEFILGEHAAVTTRHLIDCTSSVTVGDYSTVGGWRSQILTHSIDFDLGRQTSKPVVVGRYCFVSTGCVLLAGSRLPDFSILAAASLLNDCFSETHYLYGGSPCRPIKPLSEGTGYFLRRVGLVN